MQILDWRQKLLLEVPAEISVDTHQRICQENPFSERKERHPRITQADTRTYEEKLAVANEQVGSEQNRDH